MSGTLESRIQDATKVYRDVTVAALNENQVRAAALALGINGSQTTPLVTLREELVQQYRNRLRKNAYPAPVTMVGPVAHATGNPGNGAVSLSDA